MEMSKEDVAKARLWEAFKGGQQYMVETGKNPGPWSMWVRQKVRRSFSPTSPIQES